MPGKRLVLVAITYNFAECFRSTRKRASEASRKLQGLQNSQTRGVNKTDCRRLMMPVRNAYTNGVNPSSYHNFYSIDNIHARFEWDIMNSLYEIVKHALSCHIVYADIFLLVNHKTYGA